MAMACFRRSGTARPKQRLASRTPRTQAVNQGEKAPDFTLKDQNGSEFSLSGILGSGKKAVLFFFPKADTPGCTTEACSFRDAYSTFQGTNTEVVGISNGTPDEHKKFAEKHSLPFTLLSDEGDGVRKKYGVKNDFFILPGRETFVLDEQGTVKLRFNSQANPTQHYAEALKVLESTS